MGEHIENMSYGAAMKAGHLVGASAVTFGLCMFQHQSTLQAGLQPTTTSGEWSAATVHYLLNHGLESNENKTFICDPIKNTMPDVETGRAVKWSVTKDLKNPW